MQQNYIKPVARSICFHFVVDKKARQAVKGKRVVESTTGLKHLAVSPRKSRIQLTSPLMASYFPSLFVKYVGMHVAFTFGYYLQVSETMATAPGEYLSSKL